MCKEIDRAWKMKGKELTTPAAIASADTAEFAIEANDGDVIGISTAETYARVDLGKIFLTVETMGRKIIEFVPITQLLPDNDNRMWVVNIPRGSRLKVSLNSKTANALAATPIVLIFHHKDPKDCKI